MARKYKKLHLIVAITALGHEENNFYLIFVSIIFVLYFLIFYNFFYLFVVCIVFLN